MLDNLIRRDIFVDFPTVTNITFRYLNLSQWKKFEKKKITKNETKKHRNHKRIGFPPLSPPPVIDCRPNNAKFILHAFKKKKKNYYCKLLVQTFFPMGKQRRDRYGRQMFEIVI